MNKHSFLATLLVCITLLLSACGSSIAPESTNSSPAAAVDASPSPEAGTEEASDAEPATHIVKTSVGDVEIPLFPKRIIVDWNIGHLLALGLTPIGVPHSLLDYGLFLRESLPDTVEDIGAHQEMNLEKIMSLNPDLIVTWSEDNYDKLSKIAPTLVFNTDNYQSAEEEMTALGDMLGLQEAAAKWNKSFEVRLEAARQKIAEAVPPGSTFTILEYNWDKTVLVVGATGNRGGKTVYELLGLTPPPKVQSDIIDKQEWAMNVSWEVLDQYVGDYMIDLRASDATQERENSIWANLPAVKNNQVYEFNIRKYFNADPLSYIQQAEEIAESLATQRHVMD